MEYEFLLVAKKIPFYTSVMYVFVKVCIRIVLKIIKLVYPEHQFS